METLERGEQHGGMFSRARNWNFFTRVRNLFLNIPNATKVLAISMLILYIFGLFPPFANLVALIAG
jgi:hypothetical protein